MKGIAGKLKALLIARYSIFVQSADNGLTRFIAGFCDNENVALVLGNLFAAKYPARQFFVREC